MGLTEQEIGMGLLVVTCKCCGNEYKAHMASNSLTYSFTPNYGCSKCQGVMPESVRIAAQRQALTP